MLLENIQKENMNCHWECNFIQIIQAQLLAMYHFSQNHNAAERISAPEYFYLKKKSLHVTFYEGLEGINTVSQCRGLLQNGVMKTLTVMTWSITFLLQLLTSGLVSAARRGCRRSCPVTSHLPSSVTCSACSWSMAGGPTSACASSSNTSSIRILPSR